MIRVLRESRLRRKKSGGLKDGQLDARNCSRMAAQRRTADSAKLLIW